MISREIINKIKNSAREHLGKNPPDKAVIYLVEKLLNHDFSEQEACTILRALFKDHYNMLVYWNTTIH